MPASSSAVSLLTTDVVEDPRVGKTWAQKTCVSDTSLLFLGSENEHILILQLVVAREYNSTVFLFRLVTG